VSCYRLDTKELHAVLLRDSVAETRRCSRKTIFRQNARWTGVEPTAARYRDSDRATNCPRCYFRRKSCLMPAFEIKKQKDDLFPVAGFSEPIRGRLRELRVSADLLQLEPTRSIAPA
jgi:hypothetical protein